MISDVEPVTFLVVAPQLVGDLENWSVDYSRHLPDRFTDRARALRVGEEEWGHDDFCVVTLRGGKLFAYGWGMDDFAPEDRDSLSHIGDCLSIEVHPEAIDGGDPEETTADRFHHRIERECA